MTLIGSAVSVAQQMDVDRNCLSGQVKIQGQENDSLPAPSQAAVWLFSFDTDLRVLFDPRNEFSFRDHHAAADTERGEV